jgi:DNA replication protein DnaD
MNKHKKTKPYLSTNELIIVIVLIIIMVLMMCTQLFTVQRHDEKLTTENSATVDKYKQLLLRAQELTKKYKVLSGSDTLPTDLSLNVIQSEVNSVTLSKKPTSGVIKTETTISEAQNIGKSASRNVVIGMAQDTDSKNLVY